LRILAIGARRTPLYVHGGECLNAGDEADGGFVIQEGNSTLCRPPPTTGKAIVVRGHALLGGKCAVHGKQNVQRPPPRSKRRAWAAHSALFLKAVQALPPAARNDNTPRRLERGGGSLYALLSVNSATFAQQCMGPTHESPFGRRREAAGTRFESAFLDDEPPSASSPALKSTSPPWRLARLARRSPRFRKRPGDLKVDRRHAFQKKGDIVLDGHGTNLRHQLVSARFSHQDGWAGASFLDLFWRSRKMWFPALGG